MGTPQTPETVELDGAMVEARVDTVLHGNVPTLTLVIVDGAAVVELPAVDAVAVRDAALRIAMAAKDLADQLARLPPKPARVMVEHEPDDSGMCPLCRVADCEPRAQAAAELGIGVLRQNVFRGSGWRP